MFKNNQAFTFLTITICLILSIQTHLYSQWDKETVATGGRLADIAVDSEGIVHVAYLIRSYGSDVAYGLREADQWTTTTLTNSGEINGISLAVDTSNAPHIIYTESNPSDFNFTLKHIYKTAAGWTPPQSLITSETDKMFWSPTIQIDKNNHIHITYLYTDADAGTGEIYYVTNVSGNWESQKLNSKYQNPALYDVSMAVDTEGYVHIVSYFSTLGGPGYMTNAPNGNWSGTQLIQLNWYGGQLEALIIDIALDPDSNPHVSYVGSYDGTAVEHHMYATKPGRNNPWSFQKIDEGSWSSTGNAITSDPDGVEHIAYYHIESEELRYAMNYSGSWPHETIDTPGETSNNFMRRLESVTDQNGFVHIAYEGDDNVLYATTRVELPAPNIVLSPASLAFGTVDTGQVSTKSLYIKNEGILDLNLSDITLASGDSAEFSLEHLCDTVIPGDSCQVQVIFEPVTQGEKQTALKITSDDPDTPMIGAAITGRTPYPVILLDPIPLEFDPLEVGESDVQILTIGNTGDADLAIDSVRIRDDDAGVFTYSSSCGIIPHGTNCEVEVVFQPGEVGTHTATLYVFSNDPHDPEVTVHLEGRTPSARITIQADVLDFGTVPVGNLATKQLTIENSGERQLIISGISISGTDASLFRSANTCGIISSGGSCTLDLTFIPQSIGAKSALLSIASNDPAHPLHSIILRGTGGESQNRAFVYRTEEDERFYCMDTLSSGDFVVGGGTGQTPCIAAIDPSGNILWQKTFSSGTSDDAIHAVRELWDHGFVVAGQISGRYRWIARLDPDGEIIWQKRAEEDYWGDIHDVIVTSDSGFVAVGETWTSGPQDPDMWIGRLDSSGTTLWQKLIGKPFAGNLEPNYERGLTVLEVDNGNFVVAGGGTDKTPFNVLIEHPDGGYLYGGDNANFWKFSPEGDVLWQRKIDPMGGSDFWLARIGPNDALLWQKKYPQAVSAEYIYDFTLTASGDIIAVGSIISANNNDMRVMRLSNSGDIIWQKQFTAPGHQEGYKVMVQNNGSIAIAGYYDPDIQDEDGWLVLLSPDGNLDGCASNYLVNTNTTPVSTSNTFTTITLPYTNEPGDFINADLTISDGALVAQNLCTGIPTDVDYDGVNDTEEYGPDGGDTNYDGNEDGLPDSQQDNVTSLHSFDGSGYLTITTGSGTQLEDVTAEDNPSPDDQPEDFDFPLGFFSFTITGIDTGGSAIAEFILPFGSTPLTWYKYAATEDIPSPHWYEFLYDGSVGADISESKIRLHFTDGLLGDEDITENATIIDIGGPGMQPTALEVPTLVSPENGAGSISRHPLYQWELIETAEWYHLQVALNEQFSTPVVDLDSLNTTSVKFPSLELESNTTYYWRVGASNQTDTSVWSEIWSFTTTGPDQYAIRQNYPNPIRSTTTIEFDLPEESVVKIVVYDLRGTQKEVLVNREYPAGNHTIVWEPMNYSNGIYFYRMETEAYSETKKLVILN